MGTRREPLTCPFEPSAYEGKGDRVPVDFRIEGQSLGDAIDHLDREILKAVKLNKDRLFKQAKSDGELETMYIPLRKAAKDPKYTDTLRTKTTLGERWSAKYWDLPSRKPLDPESIDWRHARFAATAWLSKVWFQGKSFGATLELGHVGVSGESLECPFEADYGDEA